MNHFELYDDVLRVNATFSEKEVEQWPQILSTEWSQLDEINKVKEVQVSVLGVNYNPLIGFEDQ